MNIPFTGLCAVVILIALHGISKDIKALGPPQWININTEEARYLCFTGTLEGALDKISLNGVQYNCKEME